jgi:hypothetical protein
MPKRVTSWRAISGDIGETGRSNDLGTSRVVAKFIGLRLEDAVDLGLDLRAWMEEERERRRTEWLATQQPSL